MYLFYLGGTQLPVAPESVKIKIKNQNKTMNLINDSEINVIKTQGLTEISFSALLPSQRYPWAQHAGGIYRRPWQDYLNEIRQLKENMRPFLFIISREKDDYTVSAPETIFDVTLEEYTIDENAKNGLDVMVDIKLKQYKAYSTKKITITNSTASTTQTRAISTVSGETRAREYVIVVGDTLWGIAKRLMGDGAKEMELYKANEVVIEEAARKRGSASSSYGQLLFAGTVLKIPS